MFATVLSHCTQIRAKLDEPSFCGRGQWDWERQRDREEAMCAWAKWPTKYSTPLYSRLLSKAIVQWRDESKTKSCVPRFYFLVTKRICAMREMFLFFFFLFFCPAVYCGEDRETSGKRDRLACSYWRPHPSIQSRRILLEYLISHSQYNPNRHHCHTTTTTSTTTTTTITTTTIIIDNSSQHRRLAAEGTTDRIHNNKNNNDCQ